MEKKYISNKEFNEMGLILISMIKQSGFGFERVVGIANGGLNISHPLSTYFYKPHEEITISFYSNGYQECYENAKVQFGNFDPYESNFLLVDDLVDSGSTLKRFLDEYDVVQGVDFMMASLFWNPYGEWKQKPDFFVEEKIDKWIVFPWEDVNV